MRLNKYQRELLEFATFHHKGQVREHFHTPYIYHPIEVATLVKAIPNAIEVALCHDLLEETKCTPTDLFAKLIDIGYDQHPANLIFISIKELTDKFTPAEFPHDNRTTRKYRESLRMGSCLKLTQTVKYADIINNLSDLQALNSSFVKLYLKEKRQLLRVMREGDPDLYIKACYSLVLNEEEFRLISELA